MSAPKNQRGEIGDDLVEWGTALSGQHHANSWSPPRVSHKTVGQMGFVLPKALGFAKALNPTYADDEYF